MAVSSAANSATFKVTTPAEREIHMTRLFDAPPDLVFEAMSTPEHIRRWWGNLGDGYSVPVCEVDLRVGGKWRFVNAHPTGQAEFYGEYLEIDPPHRLVFTETFAPFPDSPSTVTTHLAPEGRGTRVTISCVYPSRDVRDMVLGTGMEKGAALSYDRLEDVLAELVSRS
jgi:uncharacterized protein YndB with AHSA1/START domain